MNTLKKLTAKFLACILFAANSMLFTSCSNPTSAGQKMAEEMVMRKSNSCFKLTDFKKTDAIQSKEDGVDIYSMHYTGTLEAIKDGSPFLISGTIWLSEDLKGMYHQSSQKITKTGEKYTIKGFVKLAKHEQGWVEVVRSNCQTIYPN